MKLRLLLVLCISMSLSACITYRDFPEEMVNNPPKEKRFNTLYYNIKSTGVLSLGNGADALQTVFKQRTPFTTTEKVETAPARGVYCEVETLYKTPTVPAFAFGYLSVATLTILPFWSNHDGYRVNYTVYKDGQKAKTFEYDITRKGAVWLLLLPVAWVNAFTYSEAEAFEATAYQFFKDSAPLFVASR